MKKNDIYQIIRENRSLFWSVGEANLKHISVELAVETILSYGDEKSVKALLSALGTKKVAAIFFKQTSRKRCNYPPRTRHYFSLYFRKYA